MAYTLEYLAGETCLRVRVDGDWPRGDARELLGDIVRVWAESGSAHGRLPVLIDLRAMQDSPTVTEDYHYAGQFAAAGFRQLGGVAFLDRPDRREANDFFETASFNRGLTFRFFYDEESDAIEWLLNGRGP